MTSERTSACELDFLEDNDMRLLTPRDEPDTPTQVIVPISHGSACPGHVRRLYSRWKDYDGPALWRPWSHPANRSVKVSEEYL